MFAIYKRELHGYFTSMVGYLVLAVTLLFMGINFVLQNLTRGSGSFAASLYSMAFVFLLTIPILTMRSISEDRKNRTDQLLLTSPVTVSGIVLGKYLAMITVILIFCLVSCVCPFLLQNLGAASLSTDLSMILAFFLYGSSAAAIGLFISSLTESQLLACIGTYGVLIVLQFIPNLAGLIPSQPIASAIGSLSLSARLDNFYNDIFDLTAVVFYLSIICVFLFLTVQTVEKRRWS